MTTNCRAMQWNESAAFAHALRASQLSRAFLHSLTPPANNSGSMMMSVTTAAMLNALTCMMIFLSSQSDSMAAF
jgi:hypothetical protein